MRLAAFKKDRLALEIPCLGVSRKPSVKAWETGILSFSSLTWILCSERSVPWPLSWATLLNPSRAIRQRGIEPGWILSNTTLVIVLWCRWLLVFSPFCWTRAHGYRTSAPGVTGGTLYGLLRHALAQDTEQPKSRG